LQAANVMVAIAGDRGNTVPKSGISATEISILMAIHGPDAIYDIEPVDDLKDEDGKAVRGRDELARLRGIYNSDAGRSAIERLYPGAGAKPIEDLDQLEELGMTDESMKPTERASVPAVPRTKAAKQQRKQQEAVDDATEDGVARPQSIEAVQAGTAKMPDSGVLPPKPPARGGVLD
jgi:hypothetical protein